MKGGDAQIAELPLHSLLHRAHVDAGKETWGGNTEGEKDGNGEHWTRFLPPKSEHLPQAASAF